MPTMRHKVEGNIFIKIQFRVLGKLGAIEIDVPPEVFFGEQRRLAEIFDEEIDKFLVRDAMTNMPAGRQ